ncbi:hypothetical protein HELRODRAFT_137534, partial [Helobdella robusta]|uniref:Ig-like domain-containing protein n=1 Tax=Helobdella robusta TaxID=6412 RepID=T1EIL2_HELRO
PKILSHPSPLVHVTSGKSFVLSCFTSGQPEPSVVWLKDDVIIDFSKAGDRVSTFESGYLVVADGRERDGGRYRCMAKNRAGLVYSKSSQVIVRG